MFDGAKKRGLSGQSPTGFCACVFAGQIWGCVSAERGTLGFVTFSDGCYVHEAHMFLCLSQFYPLNTIPFALF